MPILSDMFFRTPIVPDTSSSCSSCCSAISWYKHSHYIRESSHFIILLCSSVLVHFYSIQNILISPYRYLTALLLAVLLVRCYCTCCWTCCSSIKWELVFCSCRSSRLYLSGPGCQIGPWAPCSPSRAWTSTQTYTVRHFTLPAALRPLPRPYPNPPYNLQGLPRTCPITSKDLQDLPYPFTMASRT